MGSDIQSLAIPAKGCDFVMNHAAGLTPFEILYSHSKTRSCFEVSPLLSCAVRKYSLADVRCIDFQSKCLEGMIIA